MVRDASKPAPAVREAAWWLQSAPTATARTTAACADPGALPEHRRCPVCARANPAAAYYCHFDGKPLFEDLQHTPRPVGSMPFPAPFCFAGGRVCANYNQLALACNNLWDEARTLLTEGIWTTYFASMGRLDIAAAATQAAREPDADRGLSRLLERFPADAQFLRPPRLAVGAADIQLGPLVPGGDYTFDLVVENQGMLLLHGVAQSHCDWLAFAEPARPLALERGPVVAQPCPPHAGHGLAAQKFFQTKLGCTIPVRVVGAKLRAGLKAMCGEIVVESNGGAVVVTVRLQVPVRAFPAGGAANVLAGVRSPRELAVKAKKHPTEAGALFEQGAVKAWYASNGWTYPIQGADGVGAGAVQQFFEALGLTAPPRLEIDAAELNLQGHTGETLSAVVTLQTCERKPVYAQAWSDQDWLTTGPFKYLGTRVQIPVDVVVPAGRSGSWQAQLTIQGNARQRFVVPVNVTLKKR